MPTTLIRPQVTMTSEPSPVMIVNACRDDHAMRDFIAANHHGYVVLWVTADSTLVPDTCCFVDPVTAIETGVFDDLADIATAVRTVVVFDHDAFEQLAPEEIFPIVDAARHARATVRFIDHA